MICSYRSAAIVRIYAVIRAMAPVTSIMVTCRMVKRTIRDIPNEERIPFHEA